MTILKENYQGVLIILGAVCLFALILKGLPLNIERDQRRDQPKGKIKVMTILKENYQGVLIILGAVCLFALILKGAGLF